MSEIVSVNASRCRMWSGHERLEEQLSEENCRDEIASVLSHGQRLPALGRPLKRDPIHDFELIYGSRRLFVCSYLNVPLLVELKDLSDREAIIALDIENRLRKDLSPYERGRSLNAWLRAGLFESQDELAKVLNISASQVSRLLKLAQLPTVIVNAFPAPTDICETWGRDLMELWEDPDGRRQVAADAREIGRRLPRPAAARVYERLMVRDYLNFPKRAAEQKQHDEVIKDECGNSLFRIRVRRKDVAILLPARNTPAAALTEIKTQLAAILQRARSQVLEEKDNNCRTHTAESLRTPKRHIVRGVNAGGLARLNQSNQQLAGN